MAGTFNLMRLSPWAILLSGLAMSLLAHRYVEALLRNDAQAKFERQSREIHRAIAGRLTSYTGLLWGVRGLYQASGKVSRGEFRDYARGLDLARRYPAVMSINFAEQVLAADRPVFEQRIRGDRSFGPQGHAGFHILPAGDRARYQVLTQLEPFEPQFFGIDLEALSSPRFDEIAASGGFVSSGELVPHQPGLPLALRLAVYKRALPLDDEHARKRAFLGSLGMGFSLRRLMQETVSPEALSLIRIRIYNTGRSNEAARQEAGQKRSLLIDTATLVRPFSTPVGIFSAPEERLAARTHVDFGGALLELSFDAPMEAFATPHSRYFSGAAFAAGATASLLLALLVGGLLRSKHRLETAVAGRSSALQAANQALEEEIAERNRLEREVMRGLVEERRRFGQELHDNLGQQLTAAAFQIEILRMELENSGHQGCARIEAIGEHLAEVAGQTRKLAHGLNPVAEHTGGLSSALQRLAEDVSANSRRECGFTFFGSVIPEEASLEHNLFRMAQQAVSGAVARHAYRIMIELRSDAGGLVLQVTDNGDDIAASAANKSVDSGIRFIRYRCSVLGLELHMLSGKQGGITLRIVAPRANHPSKRA